MAGAGLPRSRFGPTMRLRRGGEHLCRIAANNASSEVGNDCFRMALLLVAVATRPPFRDGRATPGQQVFRGGEHLWRGRRDPRSRFGLVLVWHRAGEEIPANWLDFLESVGRQRQYVRDRACAQSTRPND